MNLEDAIRDNKEIDYFNEYSKEKRGINLRKEEVNYFYQQQSKYINYYAQDENDLYLPTLMACKDVISWIDQCANMNNN